MEIAEILKLRQNANGLNKLMNMHVITLDKDGGATVEVELTDELLNPLGMAHGGTIFTLCDIAAGSAAASQGTVAVTLDSSINYPTLRNIRDGKEMKKANPDLTEEEGRAYLDKRTDEMLALADNYDGIIADYTGRSLVSLKGEELEVYTSRQTNFLNKLKEWKQASDKSLFFYTNVQYLTVENMGIIGLADYIILKTALSTNGDDLSVKALLAVQAGEDAKELYEGINPVPADRFIACVQLPQPDDKNQVVGYWNTVDSEGNKTLATQGAAWWNVQASTGFERKGMFVMNVQDDYYNNTFSSIREVISIMNPSK